MESYVIVPGKSIGPFELGMTRMEIVQLGIEPMQLQNDGSSLFFPLKKMNPEQLAQVHHPSPGVYILFDDVDSCDEIHAILSYDASPPVFTWYGRVANGMPIQEATSLLQSVAADTRRSYAWVSSKKAGLKATMYEASDEHIMAITIKPPEIAS